MNSAVQPWHDSVMAQYWAENNTTGPEIAYFQQQILRYGQPALDAGCGTGRLLFPFLRAGLDVDGCDVSGDMLAYCRATAERKSLTVRLYQQALHEHDLPRSYQTIVACGVFGIGVSRQQGFPRASALSSAFAARRRSLT
jgi:2-polyprenyl-3-methyl-5-hydroxy-6-metoxy-1,4-benzoquinol methylase